MNTLKLIALAAFVLLFSQCKSPTQATQSGQPTVLESLHTLDTVYRKFYEFAKQNPNSTPQQVLELTRKWIRTQPNVANASSLDSTFIDIEMKSGLRTTFMIILYGADSLCISRGGKSPLRGNHIEPGVLSKNIIKNRNVLIFVPFTNPQQGRMYDKGELQNLVNLFTRSGKDFTVKLVVEDQCSVNMVESFGDYGLVIIDTHGLPESFLSGQTVPGIPLGDDITEALIKEKLDDPKNLGPGGLEKVRNGYFRFALPLNLSYQIGWQKYLTEGSETSYGWQIMISSKFINSLPPMPNTIIFGNFCYSGWSKLGETHVSDDNTYKVQEPIKAAFVNQQPISYYSYAYDNGSSRPVDNNFSKSMEDSLIRQLVVNGDSTGHAYLNQFGNEFTAKQLQLPQLISPDLPFKHSGADDYSYNDCVNVFTDNRDGIIYKAVCIGKQTWMAENLRYTPGGSCYPGADCNKYGRLYEWQTVMSGSFASAKNPSGVPGICPKGWHLPSEAEWRQLITTIGGTHPGGDLKSLTDWNSPNTGATDKYGFSALPGGLYYPDSSAFYFLGQEAHFWTSSLSAQPGSHSYITLTSDGNDILFGNNFNGDEKYRMSCRCLKD